MKKITFIFLALMVAVGVAAVFAPEAPAADTVKIGFNAPLSGPSAAWGLPGLDGTSIWVDKINAAGGIKVGDKNYKVEIVKYDDEGDGAKGLLGCKKLVLEDKVVAMLMLGGPDTPAVQPFLTKEKVMSFTLIASDISPERPYLMDVTDNFPTYHLLHIQHIADVHPKAKRAAILSQDDEIGLAAIAWSEAGFKANDIDVVYKKPFAMDTTDFAPLITAVLATKPDIISMGAAYPEFQALICEQAFTQGWRGIITSACWDFAAILAKVPKTFMEGAVSGFPDFDDPKLTPKHHEFWKTWKSRYPDHSFSEIVWEYMGALEVWAYGAQKAGSVESEKVFNTLKASLSVPHSFGPGNWWGKEVFGQANLLVPTWPITEIHNGKPAIVAWKNLGDWMNDQKNKKILFDTLKAWNIKTYQ